MIRLFLLLAGLFCLAPAYAQKQKAKSEAQPAPTVNAELYKGIKWRNIGPFRGGRANAISGIPQNDNVYYVGYTGGGVAKTEDAGILWKNISDGFLK